MIAGYLLYIPERCSQGPVRMSQCLDLYFTAKSTEGFRQSCIGSMLGDIGVRQRPSRENEFAKVLPSCREMATVAEAGFDC